MNNNDNQKLSLKNDKVFWYAFAFGIIIMLIFIVYYTLLCNDASDTYARMVRQFAEGRYKYAFYPAIPPLMIVFSGIVAKIGFEAYTAIKITCALFYLAGLFPLRAIMRRCLPDHLASWTCVIYVISFYIVKNVVWGVPFALKMFFLLCCTYLIIKFAETRKIKYTLLLGVLLALLALSRGECIMFLPFFIFWFFILPFFKHYRENRTISCFSIIKKQIPGLAFILIMFIAVCLPQLIYVYNNTGIPFTEKRTAETMMRKINAIKSEFHQLTPQISNKIGISNASKKNIINNKTVQKTVVVKKTSQKKSPYMKYLNISLKETFAGLYPFFVILIIFGLIWMFKKRKYSILDIFFASIILFNIILMYVGMDSIVEYRYVAVTQPFEFGWVVLGAYYIYSWKLLPAKRWNRLMLLVLIGVILGLLVDTTTYLRKQMAEGNPERVVGKWISNNKNKFPSKKLIVSGGYYTDNLPVISTGIAQYAYWAKGDWALLSGRSLTYNDVLNSMNRHNATVFIYDGGTPSKCPTFDNNWEKNFILVKDFKKLGIKVLRLKE